MHENRLMRLRAQMQEQGLEQLLVTAPSSIFYLTGRRIEPGERMLALYVDTQGNSRLYANRLFALSGNVDADLVEYDDTEDAVAVLAEGIRPGVLGIDKVWPSQFTIRLMEKRGDVRPVVGSPAIDRTRMIKDAAEIEAMKRSSALNDQVMRDVLSGLRRGMTELEGSELYTRSALARGASGNSFEPLVCYGANCAEPHHGSDAVTRLKDGDAVIIDVGLLLGDYCSDMTRTVFCGAPTDEQKKVYDLVKRANAAGRAAVRPGVPLREVDRAARQIIEEAGYGKYFIHRTGHNIGLEVHEYPDVSAASGEVCQEGMCFSVEPGIYLPGCFGVRIEDLVVVTRDGCLTLNEADREIISL